MSARSPTTLPLSDFRPRIRPTTPVRPIPVATSSTPKERSLSATVAGAVYRVENLGMTVEVAAPGDDIIVELGKAIDDRHGYSSEDAR
jgi:hypothetical protein